MLRAPNKNVTSKNSIVYVIQRGWHTDIGLPVEEIIAPLAVVNNAFAGARFLTFGFGEQQFAMSRHETFAGMLNALLPSRSVLLMTGLKTSLQAAFGRSNVVALNISRAGLLQMEDAIWQELEHTSMDTPVLLADGPYPGSIFYKATDTYYGLFTCNTWTAKMLLLSGLPMPVTGILFSGQVMGMARWLAVRQPATSGSEGVITPSEP